MFKSSAAVSVVLSTVIASLRLITVVHGLESRPNFLWITIEDISPDLGCYGVEYADTPNIDKLATEGVRYTRAWSNAGMCAPARATLITGMYPPGTGAQNMRSEVLLPDFIRAFPEYLRQSGYYTSNHSKTDYNWIAPAETWTVTSSDWVKESWRKRKKGQPFFSVINILDTHSSQMYWRGKKNYDRRARELGTKRLHDPAQIRVPPYYPDTPEIRADLARYHDNISYADGIVGNILQQLEEDGLAENTIVFLFSDHGRGMPRSKGWTFYSSLRVPMIVRFPSQFSHLAPPSEGNVEDRIVSFVDFGPTVLSLAGIEPPEHMDGVPFLGPYEGKPRTLAFAFRDRMDERNDFIRSVWDGRYHYIRNYFPYLPWFHEQTRDYPHTQDSYIQWQKLSDEGKLTPETGIYMARTRPAEMLFDTAADPHEMNNLAKDPQQTSRLREFRTALHRWQDDIIDLGFMPESYWFEQFEAKGNLTPRYTLVRESDDLYPWKKLRRLADDLPNPQADNLIDAWNSSNVPTRFWAGLGLLTNNVDTPEVRLILLQSLEDPSPTIRYLAAQILATHQSSVGNPLQVLVDGLYNEQPLVALRAANALDHLGELARPVLPQIQSYLKDQKNPTSKGTKLGAEFPGWVLQHTVAQLKAAD